MAVTFASNVVTITSASTEGSPDTLADIVTAVGNTALCRMDSNGNFWIGSTVAGIVINGWLLIDNGQSFQTDGATLYVRRNSGGGMTFRPRSRWLATTSGSAQDPTNNTFRTGFTCVCERDAITGEIPLWMSVKGIANRWDGFSVQQKETPLMKIDGLHIYSVNGASFKLQTSSGGFFRYLTITRDSTVTNSVFEFQSYLTASLDAVFDDMTLVNFSDITSHDGYTGRKFILNRPRFSRTADFAFRYLAGWGNGTTTTFDIVDPTFVGVGVWNGQITRISGGSQKTCTVRVLHTDRERALFGVAAIQDVNMRWVSSDATNAPAITDVTAADGYTSQQQLLRAIALPANTTTANVPYTPTPITWSLYARKYGRDVQPEWAQYESTTPTSDRDAVIQATVTVGIIDSQATADTYTGISLTDHGGSPVSWNSKLWRYTITGDLTANPSLTAANIWHYLESAFAKQSTIGGVPGLELHDMVNRLTPTTFETLRRSGRGVRAVDENGDPFPGFVLMTSDDGTTYAPPVQYTVTVINSISGFEARVRDGTITIDHVQDTAGQDYVFNYVYGGTVLTYTLQINEPGFIPITLPITLADQSQSIELEMEPDPSYVP